MTVLDVDEVIADVARHLRRTHESGGDAIQLIVRQHVEAAGKAGVELWMRVGGERRRRAVNRPGEAARMRQLQTDVEVVGGAGPKRSRCSDTSTSRKPAIDRSVRSSSTS